MIGAICFHMHGCFNAMQTRPAWVARLVPLTLIGFLAHLSVIIFALSLILHSAQTRDSIPWVAIRGCTHLKDHWTATHYILDNRSGLKSCPLLPFPHLVGFMIGPLVNGCTARACPPDPTPPGPTSELAASTLKGFVAAPYFPGSCAS